MAELVKMEHAKLGYQDLVSLVKSLVASGRLITHSVLELVLNYDEISDEACAMSGIIPIAFEVGVTKFEMLRNQLGPMTCQVIAKYLPSCNLTRLKLGGNPLGDQGVSILAEGLKFNRTIIQLNLGSTNMGDLGMIALCGALLGNANLESLCLRDNHFGTNGMKALSVLLTHDTCRISELQFRQNQLHAAEVQHLATALAHNSTLTSLELESTGLTAKTLSQLCVALNCNRYLHTLNLNRNWLGDEGILPLTELLAVNHSIASIELRENNITAVGCAALTSALSHSSCITGIDLGMNRIGDNGADATARWLIRNQSLERLDVSDNEIHIPGMVALSMAMFGNAKVKHLDVSNNFNGDHGATEWAKVLRNNSTLVRLSLTNNEITNRGAKLLVNALASNFTLRYFCVGGQSTTPPVANKISWRLKSKITEFTSRNRAIAMKAGESLTCMGDGPSQEGFSATPAYLLPRFSLSPLQPPQPQAQPQAQAQPQLLQPEPQLSLQVQRRPSVFMSRRTSSFSDNVSLGEISTSVSSCPSRRISEATAGSFLPGFQAILTPRCGANSAVSQRPRYQSRASSVQSISSQSWNANPASDSSSCSTVPAQTHRLSQVTPINYPFPQGVVLFQVPQVAHISEYQNSQRRHCPSEINPANLHDLVTMLQSLQTS